MSGQTWTPAPRKRIIPLHPMTFGMLIGKAFAALRHNPKVLFGFAVVIQLVVVVITAGVMGVVLFTTFARLETVSPSSPDYEAVAAGTIAINLIASIAVSLASIAFTAVMQGVVAAEVGAAAVGEKATLRTLWKRMAPAFWRLVGFASLSIAALFGGILIVALIVWGLVAGGMGDSTETIAVIVGIVVLLALAAIPLVVWLSTKLLLVPSILVLEHATFRDALVRSWRLTRGRFWVAFGVMFVISFVMGLAMQVVGLPVSILSGMLGSIIAPTGTESIAEAIGFVFAIMAPQILLLVLQAITLVVQSTGGALLYLDCRMRYEALDQTLLAHVERRELGESPESLGDPYIVDPARAVTSAPPPAQVPEHVMMSAGYAYAAQGNPQQPYAWPPSPAQYGQPPATAHPPQPDQAHVMPPPYAPPAPAQPVATPTPPPAAPPTVDSPSAPPTADRPEPPRGDASA